MDLEQFPQILRDIITDIKPRLEPLIATTHILPQVKEVTTLNRRLTRSIRTLRDAIAAVPDAIESVHLHILEEGALPNNVRAGVQQEIHARQEKLASAAAAAAQEARLRARGNVLLPMPRVFGSRRGSAEGGRRRRRRRVTRRRP